MKNIEITPGNISGEILIPPSKSISHRAIISGGLAKGVSLIKNVDLSEDIVATCEGMKALGVDINIEDDNKGLHKIKIVGKGQLRLVENEIDCGESGSTLRFLIPLAILDGKKVIFNGKGKLVERPLNTYYEIFDKQGINYNNNDGNLPLTIEGSLKPDDFRVKGNISSQFISGLMFSLPLLEKESKIIITTSLESKGYVDLTMDILKEFGINIENNNYEKFTIRGGQCYKPREYEVEGDYSQAAFYIVAGILGGRLRLKGLKENSLQGDKVIIDIVKDMGGSLSIYGDTLDVLPGKSFGVTIDASQCPDLVPILAVLASLSKGITKITNASRLRIKESDRLKAISSELNKLGGNVEELEDGLIIEGKEMLDGGVVDSWGDHRIAMALAIASIRCKDKVVIKNSEVVKKSYPKFWEDFAKLGGIINEWSMG